MSSASRAGTGASGAAAEVEGDAATSARAVAGAADGAATDGAGLAACCVVDPLQAATRTATRSPKAGCIGRVTIPIPG